MSIADAKWLMRHTVPVPGERAAAAESWLNVLANLGVGSDEARRELEVARARWNDAATPRRRRRAGR